MTTQITKLGKSTISEDEKMLRSKSENFKPVKQTKKANTSFNSFIQTRKSIISKV